MPGVDGALGRLILLLGTVVLALASLTQIINGVLSDHFWRYLTGIVTGLWASVPYLFLREYSIRTYTRAALAHDVVDLARNLVTRRRLAARPLSRKTT